MIIRLTVIIIVVLVLAASSWAQGVMLNVNEDGSYVEAGYLVNRYGSGGGAALGLTRGPLDFGIECGYVGGEYLSSTTIAQEAGIDFSRLAGVDAPVTLQIRQSLGLGSNSNIFLTLGPAMYLRAADPLGATLVFGGGVAVVKGLSGYGATQESETVADLGLALGIRTARTCVSLVGSASFANSVTTYSLGLNLTSISSDDRTWKADETWE